MKVKETFLVLLRLHDDIVEQNQSAGIYFILRLDLFIGCFICGFRRYSRLTYARLIFHIRTLSKIGIIKICCLDSSRLLLCCLLKKYSFHPILCGNI